jgi:hypothetical protein
MVKVLSAYGNAFAATIPSISALYDAATNIPSLNGLYLALDGSIDKSYINANQDKVKTWYDLTGSTNYLYSSLNSEPSFISADSVLKGNSSIGFSSTGDTRLLFKNPVSFKTIIIVYYLKEHSSYLLYAPKNTPPPDPAYYDDFPSFSDKVWTRCNLSNDLAYNSASRINTRNVLPSTFLPLNSPRILTLSNLGGVSATGVIQGIGGRNGVPNGGERTQGIVDSVKGNIAAILTFEDDLDNITLTNIELLLRDAYINYVGSAVVENKRFKYLYQQSISYDFSQIVIDEWSTPTTYELLSPNTLNLSFNGSVLQGSANIPYEGKIKIRITNALGLSTVFEFDFEINRADPLVSALPEQNNLVLSLSSGRNIDGFTYGVYKDTDNDITKWEDARRVNVPNSVLVNNSTVKAEYVTTGIAPSVRLPLNSKLTGPTITGKSFLWVYKQSSIGNRYMLDGFPDRIGTGVFWTTGNSGQIFGQTDVTALRTYVNKVQVNTLLYRNSVNKLNFIWSVQPNDIAIPFYGLSSMLGELYFLAVWDKKLTIAQMSQAISVLSDRYVPSQAPFIVSSSTEFKLSSDVVIDLSTKIVDLKNRALSYVIQQNHYSATIVNNILSFTGVTDELLTFIIDVTNSGGFTTTLTFNVDITLRTNSLYLALKGYLNTLNNSPIVSDVFLATNDSVVLSSGTNVSEWKDYRLNSTTALATNLNVATLPSLNNRLAVSFPSNGTGYLDLSTSIVSSNFIIVYVKPFGVSGEVFLLGNDSTASFAGNESVLFDSAIADSSVLFGTKYVNKKQINNKFRLKSEVLNIVYVNTTSPMTVDTIAKDRVFTNKSVKGLIPLIFTLDRQLAAEEIVVMDSIIRDYYDPIRFVLLLHFNNTLADASSETKTLIGNPIFSTNSKFGSHALQLLNGATAGVIGIPNEGHFAYLNEDFTISFWLAITAALATDVDVSLYSQTNLVIFFDSTYLYVGRSTADFILRYELPVDFYATQIKFNHIEVSKYLGKLTLYVNGINVSEIDDIIDYYTDPLSNVTEYFDTVSSASLGGVTGTNSNNSIIYMDEFVILRRAAIHTSDFVVPASEYI